MLFDLLLIVLVFQFGPSSAQFVPLHYNLEITPNFDTWITFQASVAIDLQIQSSDVSSIKLDINNLEIKSVTVDKVATTFIHDLNQLSITADEGAFYPEYVKIEVTFTGVINEDDNEGFYVQKTEKEGKFLVANLRYNQARALFPCFDQPESASTFTLRVQTPKNYYAVSNMPKTSETDLDPNFNVVSFAKSDLLPTYLLSFVICDFEHKTTESKVTVITSVADSSGLSAIAATSANYVKKLKEVSPLPVPAITHVVLPDYALNEEVVIGPGLILSRESSTLNVNLQVSEEFVAFNMLVAETIAKQVRSSELSYMWRDYFLNEAYSRDRQFEILNSISEHLFEELYIASQYENALEKDIGSDAFALQDINELTAKKLLATPSFGAKSYAVLRSIKSLKTVDSVLDSGIVKYWSYVKSYPILNVERTNDTNLMISQEPASDKNSGYLWFVPINLLDTNDANPKFVTVLENQSTSTEVKNVSWYLVNVNQIGFYRVNYDIDTWNQIINVLKVGFISILPELSRSQLIEDAYYLSHLENKLPATTYLNLVTYIALEERYAPLQSFFKTANQFRQMLKSKPDLADKFTNFVIDHSTHLFDRYHTSFSSETHLDRLTRTSVLKSLCKFGLDVCRTEMHRLLTSASELDPQLEEAVACGGMYSGGLEHFNQNAQKYAQTNKKHLLEAMACTDDSEVLEVYFQSLLEHDVLFKLSDVYKLDALKAIINGGDNGVRVALNGLLTSWSDIKNIFTDFEIEIIINELAGKIVTDDEKENFVNFVGCLTDEEKANFKEVLDNADKKIEMNEKWIESSLEAVETWLNKYAEPVTTTTAVVTPTKHTTVTKDPPIHSTEPTGTEKPNGAVSLTVASFSIVLTVLALIF